MVQKNRETTPRLRENETISRGIYIARFLTYIRPYTCASFHLRPRGRTRKREDKGRSKQIDRQKGREYGRRTRHRYSVVSKVRVETEQPTKGKQAATVWEPRLVVISIVIRDNRRGRDSLRRSSLGRAHPIISRSEVGHIFAARVCLQRFARDSIDLAANVSFKVREWLSAIGSLAIVKS